MKILKSVCDFFNLNFAMYAMIFFNVMWFNGGSPRYIIYYLVIVAFNVFVIYAILRIKKRVVSKIATSCEDEPPMSYTKQQELKKDIESSLQLGDLAEVSFGWWGRLVTETILMVCILCMVISQMCTIRLIFIIINRIEDYNGTECERSFLNISTNPNYTTTNMSHIGKAVDKEWYDRMYTYTGIFLPIFLLFSCISSYRSLAPFSMVGVAMIGSASIHVISHFIGTSNDYKTCLDGLEHLDTVYIFESASPQIGLLILALSNSASDNRRFFEISVVISIIIAVCGIVVVGLGLFFYQASNTFRYPLIMKFYPSLAPNILLLLGYVAFVFVLNIPLFQVLDRWASKVRFSKDIEQDFARDSVSVFEKMRRQGRRGTEEIVLNGSRIQITSEDVDKTLKAKPSSCLKYFFRFAFVVLEWSLSVACWHMNQVILAFIGIEMVSTIFMGYVLPLIQYLRLMWSEIPWLIKFLTIGIIIATIVMTGFAYYLEIGLFIRLNSEDGLKTLFL